MQQSYLKKIASVNRVNGILVGIIIGCLVGLALMAAVLVSGNYSSFMTLSLVVWGAVMITSILVNLFIANSRTRGVSRRIQALETTTNSRFENIHFRKVSDEVLLGEDWLVHHSGFDYRLWTREIIAKAEVEQKKLSSDDGILKIYTKGHSVPEELPVTSAGKVNSIVTAWLNNELTA
ncbi:MAG: hypothetical protein IKG53_04560 [Solobacterium sp.]|nr:hypothetical protein [Solobacterium sp.]